MAEEAVKKTEMWHPEVPYQISLEGRVSEEEEAGFVSCSPDIRGAERKRTIPLGQKDIQRMFTSS